MSLYITFMSNSFENHTAAWYNGLVCPDKSFLTMHQS